MGAARLVVLGAVLAGAGVVGCFGGSPPSDPLDGGNIADLRTAVVRNDYAESIFSLNIHVVDVDGGLGDFPVLAGRRLKGGESASEAFFARPDSKVTFELDGTSLGRTTNFTGDASNSKTKSLEFTYDYDLALAKFGVKFGWK